MILKKSLLYLGLCTAGFYSHGQSQSGRSITLDSRYFVNVHSNRAVAQLGLELTEATTLVPQLLFKPDSAISKPLSDRKLFYSREQWRHVGKGLSQFVASVFLLPPFQFAYHEYGHGTRTAAVGYRPYYGHGSINGPMDVENAFRSGDLYENFHSFYLASLFQTGGYTIARDDETLFPPLVSELQNGWQQVISAGGLNNEMYFSERIERHVQEYGGHVSYLIPYLNSKLSTQQYASGSGFFNDASNIAMYYEDQGYDVSTKDLRNGSITSLLASSVSYQVIYSMVQVLMGRPSHFQSLAFKGIQFPNTAFYMNREGLSYKFSTAYRTSQWNFPLALERVYQGDKRSEWSAGVERRNPNWSASFVSVIGKKIGFTAEASFLPKEWLVITGGYALYQAQNLRGQRLTPSLENGNGFHDVYLMVSVRY